MSLACHRRGHGEWRAEEERFLVAGSTVVAAVAVVAVAVAVVAVAAVAAVAVAGSAAGWPTRLGV
jgi:hypothetical protein